MKARVLFVSNLFPNSVEPGRGRFNLDQLRALREAGLDATVVAPLLSPLGLPAHRLDRPSPPPVEEIDGFRVAHPQAYYVPKWRGALNGHLYGWSVLPACKSAARDFAAGFLWGSFAFPDGVGAAQVARRLSLPLALTVHGSDVHVSFRMRGRRRAMTEAFRRSACVISKSQQMRELLIEAHVDPARVSVVYNGVDRAIFRPRSRAAACHELGVGSETRRILFVGNLVEVKGPGDLLDAFRQLGKGVTPCDLRVLGDGPLEPCLRAQARALGIEANVHFMGRESRERVALWMAASDLLALPSHDEGVPNVILEMLASGRPVVASRVGGVPEVHPGESAGALVLPRQPAALASALRTVLDRRWDDDRLVELASRFSWPENARHVLAALRAGALA